MDHILRMQLSMSDVLFLMSDFFHVVALFFGKNKFLM
jgi:hypothetical protein